MNVVVTGSAGFLGKNLVVALRRRPDVLVNGVGRETSTAELEAALAAADVVFHLAGVNRPRDEAEHEPGNAGITRALCETLRRLGRAPKIVFASSTRATSDDAYGRSKRAAEQALEAYAAQSGVPVAVFRLPNVFGKWCRPHYNSFVATFCHEIARDGTVVVEDPDAAVELAYVDDVVAAFVAELTTSAASPVSDSACCGVLRPGPPTRRTTVGRVKILLEQFREVRRSLVVPDLSDPFARRLYATYVSHLDGAALAYRPPLREDQRGFVQELLKSHASGQVFLSRTRPGVTRGGHLHDAKVEKFIVVEGQARIRFRHVATGQSIHVDVDGAAPQIVDIPPGHTHDITNTGSGELVTLFWASEIFDPERPDTYPEPL
ncbi:NAD-dependent epimerase/dehydratase family protein [Candidatus Binatia bacterium]|nr:NAD-dependent epimerase/dehydratase family protein [Candidatus Binatia bacterium]